MNIVANECGVEVINSRRALLKQQFMSCGHLELTYLML